MSANPTQKWFLAALLGSMLAVFFTARPLNAPYYRLIVADGLGYYSYLPARFIYHDHDLTFSWFPSVYNRYYDAKPFDDPLRNFMVDYGSRKINLYYPGVSLLQLPFFECADVLAPLLGYARDGFSQPYQLAIGIAGVFYGWLGLLFLFRLLCAVSGRIRLAAFVVVAIFVGTPLFTYSIFNGCYSHVYAFCFISAFLYTCWRAFHHSGPITLLEVVLCASVVVTIRPVNAIALVAGLYFFRKGGLHIIDARKSSFLPAFLLTLAITLVWTYTIMITRTQTGSLFANTYTIGTFLWHRWDHVWKNIAGFQTGLLWYAPLLLVCMCAAFRLGRQPALIWLLLPFTGMFIIYSLWWYWSIIARTMVDYSAIAALLLMALLSGVIADRRLWKMAVSLVTVCAVIFQLKSYQLRNGILHTNYTYAGHYFSHFFTFRHIDRYPVDPSTISFAALKAADLSEGESPCRESTERSGPFARLDSQHEYAATMTAAVPAGFSGSYRKLRASFNMFRTKGQTNTHLVMELMQGDSTVLYKPFYLRDDAADRWEYHEFGLEVPDITFDRVKSYFWNPGRTEAACITDFKIEFIVTDGTDEITEH